MPLSRPPSLSGPLGDNLTALPASIPCTLILTSNHRIQIVPPKCYPRFQPTSIHIRQCCRSARPASQPSHRFSPGDSGPLIPHHPTPSLPHPPTHVPWTNPPPKPTSMVFRFRSCRSCSISPFMAEASSTEHQQKPNLKQEPKGPVETTAEAGARNPITIKRGL